MDHSSNLLVVIATYNEIDSLPNLVKQLHCLLPDAAILIIDDNSPDGTGKWCREFANTRSFLNVFHRECKAGLGTATILGLKHAIKADFQFVATMDADGSHEPRALCGLFESIGSIENQHVGVMIGSRYVSGGSIIGWPWYRRLSSRLVNWFARQALALSTCDNTSALRVYRIDQLRRIDLDSIESTGYSYLEEILLVLKKSGIEAAELPITFRNRDCGKSKVNFKELASSLFQLVRLSLRTSRPR